MKNPNNPYTLENFYTLYTQTATFGFNEREMIDWYLNQIYQIELELKGQLTYDYRQYLQKKYMYLRTGLLCIYCQKNGNKSL